MVSTVPMHETSSNTIITEQDARLLQVIQAGLPLTPCPYRDVATQIGWTEAEVIATLDNLQQRGIIKRMGLIVRHHELGYRANAMVVWDLPDARVATVAERLPRFPFVSLCYQRRRCLPVWPFNLYCMIHGRERQAVLEQIGHVVTDCQLDDAPMQVLFSRTRFKQRGAWYRWRSGEPGGELAGECR
jgi:DNA-binding Lrp family transcriptional regulator